MTDPASGGRDGSIFKVGDLLNNTYRIEGVLGRGGTSEVYVARSEISGHRVALKALRSEYSDDAGFLNLMKREEDIREIRHDAIVRYFHNQRTADGVVFLVMDYVEGPGLDRKMREGGMSADDLMIIARRVAEGLRAAHARNIVHRDLSPDNIILRNGDPADAVIIDFGIAKDANPGAETVVGNEFAGKYSYAAPEQLSGRSDARSDIYALGALLLATFRGKAPNPGANPMEVVQGKARPLDTTGVPEPLKGVIDRMTHPDPARRTATAQALMDDLDGRGAPSPLDDATVIVPRPTVTRAPASGLASGPAPRPLSGPASPPVLSPEERSRGGGGVLVLALGGAAIVTSGTAAYLTGALDGVLSGLPVAAPYTLAIAQSADGTIRADGHVPDAAGLAAIEALTTESTVTRARGDLPVGWMDEILALTRMLEPLPEWSLEAEGPQVRLDGLTDRRSQFQTVSEGLAARRGPLQVTVDLELGPRILDPALLDPILEAFDDCGRLRLVDPPVAGYPKDATIIVDGAISQASIRTIVEESILEIAGQRSVAVAAPVLNPALCAISAALPDMTRGGARVRFSDGATKAPNPRGTFSVGETPVIDVVLPASMTDGFIYIVVIDSDGEVFALQPSRFTEEDRVEVIRDGRTGPLPIRVAHSREDAARNPGTLLSFTVEDESLGRSRVLIVHSDVRMPESPRPTESVAAFLEALDQIRPQIRSVDMVDFETVR